MDRTSGNIIKVGTLIYFAIGALEVVAESLKWYTTIQIVKPIIPFVLMILYWATSNQRYFLFFLMMSFSVITNILYQGNGPENFMPILIVFMCYRIVVIYYTIKLLKVRDFIPVLIAAAPFFCLFSYMFMSADDVKPIGYVLVLIQNILISVFGGLTLSNYIMKDDIKNSWLYMSGLLFVLLQCVVFIERYYLLISMLRPLAMLLNVCAFYCYYRFVISTENLNND
jgi:hypothetical protein